MRPTPPPPRSLRTRIRKFVALGVFAAPASNAKGVVKQTVKMKKVGVLIFTPIADKYHCNTKRVGITNVFTAPVTE